MACTKCGQEGAGDPRDDVLYACPVCLNSLPLTEGLRATWTDPDGGRQVDVTIQDTSHPEIIKLESDDGTEIEAYRSELSDVHDCQEHTSFRTWDGPLGHGYVCAVCDRLLQVG